MKKFLTIKINYVNQFLKGAHSTVIHAVTDPNQVISKLIVVVERPTPFPSVLDLWICNIESQHL